MKLSQFRALIREEVRKVVSEYGTVSQGVKDAIYNEIKATFKRENNPYYSKKEGLNLKDLFRLANKSYFKYSQTTFQNAIFALVADGKIEQIGKDKYGQNRFKLVTPFKESTDLNEDYIRKMNLYDPAFKNLSPQDYQKLNTLMQQFDKMMDANDDLFELVSDVTDPRSLADAPNWRDHFETVADEVKSKFPTAAKLATGIAAIVSKVAN